MDIQAKTQATAKEIEEGCAYAEAFAVVDQASFSHADTLLRVIADKEKELEAQRKAATGPMNTALREINGWFKPLTTRLDATKRELKRRMLAYRAEVDRQNAAAALAAAQAARTGDFAQVQEHASAMALRPVAAHATVRKTWTFRVEDLRTLPLEYHIANEAMIRAVMRTQIDAGQEPSLPGVTFWQEEGIAVR